MTSTPKHVSTVEDWARHYIESTSLSVKCQPPPCPDVFESSPAPQSIVPGRPIELQVTTERPKKFSLGSIVRPEVRARLVHKFWHHELQAAELMAWAILRFVDTPEEFRRGLIRIIRDEVRHMGLYEEHLKRLGFSLSDFPVRDWFWERVTTCETPLSFVAFIGMGLEGANLEHTARFASWFRTVGDEFGAQVQDQVGREEVAHVRFATRWFKSWSGDVDFETWRQALPAPMTPLLLKGKTLDRVRRQKAEMPVEFLDQLSRWQPE